MARQGLFVEDFSAERLKYLEDTQLIGFEVDYAPRTPIVPSAEDGLGAELPSNQPRSGRRRTASTPDAPQTQGPTEAADIYGLNDTAEEWSFGDK